MKYVNRLLAFALLVSLKANATAWDEPWAKKVITEATSFALAKVISNDPKDGTRIEIIKVLGGQELPSNLLIQKFYLLDLCSTSGGHGAEFQIRPIDSCYFFIKKNEKGEFCIATPTTGFDYVRKGNVHATYRHSYHQAAVPLVIYEKTMTAIFNNYHKLKYDEDYVNSFVNEYLSKKPAGYDEVQIKTFFLQHVALECVYHLKLKMNQELLVPFLNDKDNFHSQISAARAMGVFNNAAAKQELMKAISDTTNGGFVKVMCVWSLKELKPTEFKEQLEELEKRASTEPEGFGGNIMDPRICSRIPSVKAALEDLLKDLRG